MRFKQFIKPKEKVDMTGKKCDSCKKGTYQETSHQDDMDGLLHCTNCGKEIKKWKIINEI